VKFECLTQWLLHTVVVVAAMMAQSCWSAAETLVILQPASVRRKQSKIVKERPATLVGKFMVTLDGQQRRTEGVHDQLFTTA